jgi:hypothetical protein
VTWNRTFSFARAALLFFAIGATGPASTVARAAGDGGRSGGDLGRAPVRSEGSVVPLRTLLRTSRAAGLSTADTITIYHADFEGLVSPGSEGGWTHVDGSGTPTAWHIATTMACQGRSLWCGIIDSSWTGDPNRFGYDNSWVQAAGNFVDLAGAASPVRIGFKHRMNLEPQFDFGFLEVFDRDDGWVALTTFTGSIPNNGAGCDTFSIQIPDSIIAKTSTVQFRFVLSSDIQGSSADGLYPAADGWAVDNVTVRAGTSDIRFFDDMEAGVGTWSFSVFPPVGDFWRVANAIGTQQLCTTNTSKAWTPTDPITGALVPRMEDHLLSPRVHVNGADQVFLSFDVYRELAFESCFYYGIGFRSKKTGLPWSDWIDPTGVIYFGIEGEWMRQTVALAGAAGAESLQVRFTVKDYAATFCDGISTPSGTTLFIDNVDIRVIGLGGPSITTSETSLFNDTFRTTAFFGNDNFNTPRGDSVTVQIGASRGLKQAFLHTSINNAAFVMTPLVHVGSAESKVYYGDVTPGAYPRGTQLRYYFSATDSTNVTTTLPVDAVAAQHYFRASILPAVFAPTGLCPSDSARVLYVNAYAGPDATTGVDQSLAALGIRYDRFDVNGAASGLGNTPGGGDPGGAGLVWPGASASTLAQYSAILWDVGERSTFTLSAQDQTLIQTWLATPGRNRGVLLAGDNLAYDLVVNGAGITNFLACSIGASYVRDVWENVPQDSLAPSLAGGPGTRIGSEPFPIIGDCPGINRFDALTVSACVGAAGRSWLRYPNGLLAATERRAALSGTDSARAFLLGFSLGAMTNATRRNLFLWRTLVQEMETPYCTTPTGVESAGSGVPSRRSRLEAPAPNPFNPTTWIRFTLARAQHTRIVVYDVSGARIRLLAEGPFGAGEHRIRWDGKDDRGRDVASGAYFIRMDAGDEVSSRKVVLLR